MSASGHAPAGALAPPSPASRASRADGCTSESPAPRWARGSSSSRSPACALPRLVVDGQTITVVDPLPWYVWLWSGLPFLLIFLGGAIGAFLGLIGFSVNAKIFRSTWPMLAKFAVSAAVSVAAVVAYIVFATILYLALQ